MHSWSVHVLPTSQSLGCEHWSGDPASAVGAAQLPALHSVPRGHSELDVQVSSQPLVVHTDPLAQSLSLEQDTAAGGATAEQPYPSHWKHPVSLQEYPLPLPGPQPLHMTAPNAADANATAAKRLVAENHAKFIVASGAPSPVPLVSTQRATPHGRLPMSVSPAICADAHGPHPRDATRLAGSGVNGR